MTDRTGIAIRTATDRDRVAVEMLLRSALGKDDDPRYRAYLRWKHDENPFGASPAWVAEADGVVVGFRTFLRWELEGPHGMLRAVRAVDTATAPAFRGRGVFRRLTLAAIDELAATGLDLVFNTPNDQSRPGYLAMGWSQLGHLPVIVRPCHARGLLRTARARTAAAMWSSPCTAGDPAADVLADTGAVAELLAMQVQPTGLRTRRSPELLRWRYGAGPIDYRAITAPGGIRDGLVVFRLRSRGAAVEGAICELIVPEGADGVARSLLRTVNQIAGADYLIRLGAAPARHGVEVPLARQGPVLTARSLDGSAVPALPDWDLALGDVELF